MQKPDLTFRVLLPHEIPPNGECLGCGIANPIFVDLDGTKKSMRWFQVTGLTLSKQHWGIYCEQCLQTANIVGKEMKKIKQNL